MWERATEKAAWGRPGAKLHGGAGSDTGKRRGEGAGQRGHMTDEGSGATPKKFSSVRALGS